MATRSPAGLVEYRTHYRWAVMVITVLVVVLFFRFFVLQIVRGGEYRQSQLDTRQSRTERIPARRGLILDRNGVVLAKNVETHDLVMLPNRVKDPESIAEHVRRLLRLNDEEDAHLREIIAVALEQRSRYPEVVVRRDLVSRHCPFDSSELEPLEPYQEALWCSQCGRNYESIPPGERRCPKNHDHRLRWNPHQTGAQCTVDHQEYVAGTACPHDGAMLRERKYTLRCPICERRFNNEKAIVEADLNQMRGFRIRTTQRRVYPQGMLVAHITGYMNQVNARDLERDTASGVYAPGDRIGRRGVESAMETDLRGVWGERHTLVDRRLSQGPVWQRADPEKPDIPVMDGRTIRLTIDIKLQELTKEALRYHRSGAAVIMDVNTGEILALYSKPSYDPNLWSGRLSAEAHRAIRNNPYSPMLNKAVTPYAPGSVYKLVTAAAGLHAKLTDFEREIPCHGYKEYGGRRFRCHNRSGHGELDLIHAMSRSCDIFFYQLGEELSMDTLHNYATSWFGFGGETGIEIAESKGIVPTKEWHRQREGVWMPGYTLSTAVGQKDIRSTPLQVARAYAAFANGGRLITAHIVKQLETPGGAVVRVIQHREEGRLQLTPDEMAGLGDGFWRVVNDEHGTAFGARMDGIEVSGKTGTAEAAERKAGVSEEVALWLKDHHAWFAGYAPSRKPEISVAVFLDHGHSGGKAAAPVAMKIFKGYFLYQARHAATAPAGEPLPNPITTPRAREQGEREPVNRTPIDLD